MNKSEEGRMNKWTKFSDQMPPIGKDLWVSEGLNVCFFSSTTADWRSYFLNDHFWMEIEMPELPKKEGN